MNRGIAGYDIHINCDVHRHHALVPEAIAGLTLTLFLNSKETFNTMAFSVDAFRNVSVVQRLPNTVSTVHSLIGALSPDEIRSLLIDFLDAAIDPLETI